MPRRHVIRIKGDYQALRRRASATKTENIPFSTTDPVINENLSILED